MGYKIGDKFVIEIDKIFRHGSNGEPRYKMKGFNTLMFDDAGLDKLEPLKPTMDVLCRHTIEISEVEANRIINMTDPYVVTPNPKPGSSQYYPGHIVEFTVRDNPQHRIASQTYKIVVTDTNIKTFYTTLYLDIV